VSKKIGIYLQKTRQILSIYDYAKGAKEIINYLQGKKYTIGLISNSIDMLVENVARDLHIPLYAANNSFIFNGKDEIQEIKVSDNDTQFKQERVSRWCKELSVDMAHCIYVGDANDDRELFLASGHGITFKGSLLEPIAWKTIDTLLDIQNIL
jgi:phosphoserine phosphatase